VPQKRQEGEKTERRKQKIERRTEGELVGLLEGCGGACVDGREELDADAEVAVGQNFDAGDLAEVLDIMRMAREVIGKGDEDAHACTIRFVFGEEVDAVAGNVFGGGGLLEGVIVRIGRAHLEGLADMNAAAAPAFLRSNLLHVNMGPRKRG